MSHPRTDCKNAVLGSRASLVICLINAVPQDSHVGACKACQHYNTSTIINRATEPPKPRAESDCSPCAAAAKARLERKKHDAAEAMRILNEAVSAGD